MDDRYVEKLLSDADIRVLEDSDLQSFESENSREQKAAAVKRIKVAGGEALNAQNANIACDSGCG